MEVDMNLIDEEKNFIESKNMLPIEKSCHIAPLKLVFYGDNGSGKSTLLHILVKV